jgi:hypothetical protein
MQAVVVVVQFQALMWAEVAVQVAVVPVVLGQTILVLLVVLTRVVAAVAWATIQHQLQDLQAQADLVL